MIPNIVMGKHVQHPKVKHSEKPIFHEHYKLPKDFEDFLDEFENEYLTKETEDKLHEMYRKEIFSEEEINKKVNKFYG